jgi:hypothetical protein
MTCIEPRPTAVFEVPMKTDKYYELALTTARLSEEFYRCLGQWKKNRHEERCRLACIKVAERYRPAVDEQIAYVYTLEMSPDIKPTLNNLLEHRSRFWKELENLGDLVRPRREAAVLRKDELTGGR